MTKPRAPRCDRKERPFDLDDVCCRIEAGESMRSVSAHYAQNPGRLTEWIALDPERLARTREARERSAYACDEMALAVLHDERIDIARAREIASHLRWRAKTRLPRVFGDRVDAQLLVGRMTLEQLVTESMLPASPLIVENGAADNPDSIAPTPTHGCPIPASVPALPYETEEMRTAWGRFRSAFPPDSTPES